MSSYKDRIMNEEKEIEKTTKFEEKRTTEPPPEEGIVANADYVYLRKYPSLETGEIGSIVPRGTILKIIGFKNDFYKVKAPSDYYTHPLYIYKDYLLPKTTK